MRITGDAILKVEITVEQVPVSVLDVCRNEKWSLLIPLRARVRLYHTYTLAGKQENFKLPYFLKEAGMTSFPYERTAPTGASNERD